MASCPSSLLNFSLIFIMCTLSQFLPIKATSGNETDLPSLLAIKDSIQGLSSWNKSFHFCQWKGVRCGKRHQRVVALVLSNQSLAGNLSPSIGNLSFLRFINLGDNKISGEVPQEIGRLFRLQHLNLSYNTFQGEIPGNLSQSTDLRLIDFRQNKFSGKLPSQLGSLSKLFALALEANNLAGEIPSSIGNLSSLQYFSLVQNRFQGTIPDIFGTLPDLTFLSLSDNRLSGKIPLSIFNLSSVQTLGMNSNQLTGSLPPYIFNTLPNILGFGVGSNLLTGSLPPSLANASNLQKVDMGSNNFTGEVPNKFGTQQSLAWINFEFNYLGKGKDGDINFISSLPNCTDLIYLSLLMNNFGGVLPSSIANLSTQIVTLRLANNKITGNLPEGIGNLVQLTMLALDDNHLHGHIPSSVGHLQNLNQLSLSINTFTGFVPSSLENLSDLYVLDLSRNRLSGMIPSSLKGCQNLQILDFSNNNLNDTIPESIIGMSSLSIALDLSRNSLTGTIPSTVGKLKNVGQLYLNGNKLSGKIPNTIGSCESVEVLMMGDNLFDGTIPQEIGSLKGLRVFDVSNNNLSGEIPKALETLHFLQSLDLSSNKLEGEVPMKGVFTNTSAISLAGNVQLCGGIHELHLPKCPAPGSRKKGRTLSFKLAIAAGLSLLILVLSFIIICWKRKPRLTTSSATSIGAQHQKVSYGDLFQATNGFSPSNFIGSGSFGIVYKGILDHDEPQVAIKVFNLQHRGASKSFMAECESLRNIRHRNLVKVITSCSSTDFSGNEFKALVFEFMPNGSLDSWLYPTTDGQNGPSSKLSLLQRLNIAIDVASALNYLHQECHVSVIHRDLKPSNVLLDHDMVAHVGDFGLAKLLSEPMETLYNNLSTSTGVKGSIGYVAPEYGQGSEASIHGDIYSYGILLLEIFIGRRPTDEMFEDGLNLHDYASKALPDRVTQIVDPMLLSEEDEEGTNSNKKDSQESTKLINCLSALIEIGVACSIESPPSKRTAAGDISRALHTIRESFLGVGISAERK